MDYFIPYISVYFRQNATKIDFPASESWVVLSEIEQQIKRKIESVGTPLKDWNINIYRGILTGYNKAFIIDEKRKEELIKEDPKSVEIIRPLLRGRDIKRYSYEFANLYLITTFPSLKIDIEKYPAIKQHLLSFGKKRLRQSGEKGSRKKTNNKWFETQDSISYWEDFYKQKIVYNDIAQKLAFAIAEEGIFFNNTVYFINGEKAELTYLITFLNSPLIDWYYKTLSVQLGIKAVRLFSIYVEKIPIIFQDVDLDAIKEINTILKNESFKINESESDLNSLIYKAYGLTKEEIRFIHSQ